MAGGVLCDEWIGAGASLPGASGGGGRAGPTRGLGASGIGVRQFKRLVRAWRCDGDAGLVLASARPAVAPAHERGGTRSGSVAC